MRRAAEATLARAQHGNVQDAFPAGWTHAIMIERGHDRVTINGVTSES